MSTHIKVKGMHCDACKMLIKMELEEIGLGENIVSIQLEGNDEGTVLLEGVDAESLGEVQSAINKMEQYKIITIEND